MEGLAPLNLETTEPRHWFTRKVLLWKEHSHKIPLLFWSARIDGKRAINLFEYFTSSIHYTVTLTKDGQLIINRYYMVLDKTTVEYVTTLEFIKWTNKKSEKAMNMFQWFNGDLEIFFKPEIDSEKILGINNTEIRREAIKQIGIKKLMYEFREHITLFEKNTIGEMLFEIAIPLGRLWNNPMRFIWVRDATDLDEWYLLQVPKFFYGGDFQRTDDIEVKTIHIAKAWSFDVHPTIYHPVKET